MGRRSIARIWIGTLVGVVAVACVRPQVARPAADALPCRAAIDLRGEPLNVTIAWRSADDPEDVAPLAAWCRGVGPAVVDARPRITIDTDPEVLTIASWNMHVGGGDLRVFVAALRRGTLTDGRPVGHFVAGLQEVFRRGRHVPAAMPDDAGTARKIVIDPPDGAREDILAAAASLGLAVYYVPSMRNGRYPVNGEAEDRGNAIVSTLPLSAFSAVELPFDTQRRVAIGTVVQYTPGDGRTLELRVVSAHLNAFVGPERLWVFASGWRGKQARSLAAALDDGRPTMLASDLNTWSEGTGEPSFEVLREVLPDGRVDRLEPTFGYFRRLDYIFLRLGDGWQGEARAAGGYFGSDHRPVVGQIRLK